MSIDRNNYPTLYLAGYPSSQKHSLMQFLLLKLVQEKTKVALSVNESQVVLTAGAILAEFSKMTLQVDPLLKWLVYALHATETVPPQNHLSPNLFHKLEFPLYSPRHSSAWPTPIDVCIRKPHIPHNPNLNAVLKVLSGKSIL